MSKKMQVFGQLRKPVSLLLYSWLRLRAGSARSRKGCACASSQSLGVGIRIASFISA